jgi:chromatin structure-remodeling complex subunit RSC1/2
MCELFFSLPDEGLYPDYYVEIKEPIALDIIKQRIQAGAYPTNASFERDLRLMVANAKQYNAEGSQVWEDACEIDYLCSRALRRGGGGERTMSMEWQGQRIAVGEWVYVDNPNTPAKPTVVQVFDVKEDGRHFTGNWYLRPAQTVHKVTAKFMENEVFKTPHMQTYEVSDVVGRCAVLFYKGECVVCLCWWW